jgi:hypothetical protein
MGLGFGIRKKTIPDPGSRGSKRHRLQIRNTGFQAFEPAETVEFELVPPRNVVRLM